MVEPAIERPSCGGYRILQTLGKGGNAVVKLVEKDGAQYAMKIFEPHEADRAQFIATTQAEFDVVRGVGMSAVAQYFVFETNAIWHKRSGADVACCILVMELVDGVELIDFFNAAKRQEEKYLRHVFLKVAQALHGLHAAGVAHRDIKPENIMLTEKYEVKLIDLGYGVKLAGNETDGFNRTRLGTEGYMAPEIVGGRTY